jgi:chaperonin GroES
MNNTFDPGWKPCGHRVLVHPIKVEETTSGGIVLAASLVEKEDMAQIDAVVITIGPEAWADRPGHGDRPWCQVGDTVMIARYSGLLRKGRDGQEYRVINDLDVVAVQQGGDK